MDVLVVDTKFWRTTLSTFLVSKLAVIFAIEDSCNTSPFPKSSCYLFILTSLNYVHFTSEMSKLYRKVKTFPDYFA